MSHVGKYLNNAQMKKIFWHIKDVFYTFFDPQTEQKLYNNMDTYINYCNN